MLLELVILLVTAALVRLYLYKRRLMRGLKHLPMVQYDLPIIGAGYRFLGHNTEQIFNMLALICSEHSTPTIFWFGPTLTFLITKPEDMKAVYMSPNCLQKPYVYNFFGGNNLGIFNAPAHIWKKDRRAINPTFNNRILQSFVPVFNANVDILVETLRPYVTGRQPFDIGENIGACTLDMVCATTLGYNVRVQRNENQKFLHLLEELSVNVASRICKVWLHPQFIYDRTASGRRTKWLVDYMFDFTRQIRIVKQAEFNAKKVNGQVVEDTTDDGERSPQLFVNEMLKMFDRGEIDINALDEQLVTMIVGGNETSALTTSNVILMLAMHPDIQQRCVDELERVYDNAATPSTLELIGQLDYLEMCVRETMRLLPVGPFLGRECTADTELGNCTIPAGSFIILGNYNMHRSRDLWGERADQFDPEHFRADRVAARHPFAYVPFSGGPRNCVGIKYGWISVKIMLAAMLRRYRFHTDLRFEELRFKWDITLKVAQTHLVYVEERDFGRRSAETVVNG